MSIYCGDFPLGQTVFIYFNTHKGDGTPITLAGSPVVSIYKDDNTTQTTTGPTLTVDFDSTTGLHCCAIATTNAFYVAGMDYKAVLTAGTVDSISVVGTVIGTFSLRNRTPSVRRATAQDGAAGTITLDSSASASDDFYNKTLIFIVGGTGIGQCRLITDYTGSSKVANVSPNWVTNPSSDSVFVILPGGYSDVGSIAGTAQSARDIGASVLLSSGTSAGQISLSSGKVTVGTNDDKAGYSGSGTVTDKTGFSLSVTPPTAQNIWEYATRSLTDKADFALSTAGILAIWHQLLTAISTTGSVGKLIKDYLDAKVSDIPTAAEIDTQLSGTHGSGAWGASVVGSRANTYTVYDSDGTTPLAGCEVWATSDLAGANEIANRGLTDDAGKHIFYFDLAAGATVYIWRRKSGYTFTNPDTEVVA